MWSVLMCVFVCTYAMTAADGGGAPRCVAPAPRCTPVGGGVGDNEFEYSVDGIKIIINYVDGKYFSLDCNGGPALDSDALPRFERILRVPSITLSRCPPPSAVAASFTTALAELGVAPPPPPAAALALLDLPPEPPLAARHLAGLEALATLRVGAGASGRRPTPDAGFLAPLRALRSLILQRVHLAPSELDATPPTLHLLSLRDTGVGELAPAVLASDLRDLVVADASLAEFTIPAKLRTLSLNLYNTSLRVESIASLKTLELISWTEVRPGPLVRCNALRSLMALRPALEALPARWVAACPRLERLAVDRAARLATLPARLLEGARALRYLVLAHGVLEALPEGLLDDAPDLLSLDLTGNRLRTLPSAMFLGPRALRTLRLESNDLEASAVAALTALGDLTVLSLAYNARLGDLCDGPFGYSPLSDLKKLTSLSLNRTNVTRICRDWREDLTQLRTLDLRSTNVAELWYEDLQYRRADGVTDADVLLQGAPVAAVRFGRHHYDVAATAPLSGATVHLDGTLRCDCDMYWTRLALERGRGLRVLGLRCDSNRALKNVSVDEMLCPAPDACAAAGLPPVCACGGRPELGAAGSTAQRLVRVRCERAALRHVPPLRAARAVLYDLLLAHNDIAVLHAADLPPRASASEPHLRELDLRDNALSRVDEDAAAALGGSAHRVLLSGNPLACDCGAAPLLRALTAPDRSAATCADGRSLDAVRVESCGPRLPPAAAAAAALAALLAATAAVVLYFAPRERRIVIKVLLFRWGLLRREVERDGDGRPFDAFVSFSHEDEKIVRELVERLESGPTPYRLCLHYRDWVPGRLIPDQIVESVRRSRRTVALVSRHFLESTWARAEFREAYAHALRDLTPRLVVVLLEEAAALPLDAELRRYLAANTYVRWGDPWFWDKLRLALPTPPPRPAVPPLSISVTVSSGASSASAPPTPASLARFKYPDEVPADTDAGPCTVTTDVNSVK